jgi:hypothetical protein
MCMLKMTKVLSSIVILSSFLVACGANHYSIHKQYDLKDGSSTVIAVDAKQRFLLSSLVSKTTEATTGNPGTRSSEMYRRFCLEPSPDVFSVLSQAASGSGSFGRTADPGAINAALQAAFSSSETGTTVSRTQTVNMLKEMMYRTCERYLNGQIGELEYPIIAARDQRIMTSILAIEQITGTLQPKPVIIAATGNAATGQQATAEVLKSLEAAKKDVDDNKSALATAQKELADIDKPEGSCKALLDKKADEIKTDDDKAKVKDCKVKNSNISKAETELKAAKANYDTVVNLASRPGALSAATASQSFSTAAPTDLDRQIEQVRSQTIQTVADTVKDIVAMSFDQNDETSFFCYRELDRSINKEVSKSCIQYIVNKVDKEAARLKLETEQAMAKEINKTVDRIRALTPDQALAAEKSLEVPMGYLLTKMKDKGIDGTRLTDGEAAKKALETRAIYGENNERNKIAKVVSEVVQDWANEIDKLIKEIRLLTPAQALAAEKSLAAPAGYVLTKLNEQKIEQTRSTDGGAARKALEVRAIYSESNAELGKISAAVSTARK